MADSKWTKWWRSLERRWALIKSHRMKRSWLDITLKHCKPLQYVKQLFNFLSMFICKLAGFFSEKMSRWCLNCCQDKFHNFDFLNSRALEACTEQNTALQKCFQRSWYPICRKEQEDYWNCYRKETVRKLKNWIFIIIVSLNVYQYCLIIQFSFPKIKYYFLSERSRLESLRIWMKMPGSLIQPSPYPSHYIALRLWLRWGEGMV